MTAQLSVRRVFGWLPLAVAATVLVVCGLLVGLVGGAAGPMVALALSFAPICALMVIERPALGFVLVAVALPVGASAVPGLGVSLADFSVLSAIVVVSSAALLSGVWPLRVAEELRWAAALVVWLAVASMVAPDLFLGVRQTIVVGAGLLLATAIATTASRRDARMLLSVFMAIGGIICAASLRSASQFDARYGSALVLGRAQSIFAQPNDFGTFSALVMFVALGSLLGASRFRVGLASGVVAAVAGAGVVLSLSRGTWIGVALGSVALVVLLPERRRQLLMAGAVAIGGLAVLAVAGSSLVPTDVVFERLDSLLRGNSNPYDNRPAIWREGVRQVLANPVFGSGPGGFQAALADSDAIDAAGDVLHAHNVPLTVGAEAGIPAVLLLVAFTLAVGRRVWSSVRVSGDARDRELAAGAACALVAVIGQGVVDFTLRNPLLLGPLWFLMGVLFVLTRNEDAPSRVQRVGLG